VHAEQGREDAPTVCAVVVTCDRRDLLIRCLDRLDGQSRQVDCILVVDNASRDGTPDELRRRDGIEVLRLDENLGGAGGFRHGLAAAHKRGFDWLWVLDDDTFPEPDCLEALLTGARRAEPMPSVVASAVRWKDGTLHPMNEPWIRWNSRAEIASAAGSGLVPIRAATFVSTMIHRTAVDEHGLPRGYYFLWLDDVEYSARILKRGRGYLVPESVAVHWTERPYNSVSDTRDRFYFKVRNQLWVLRGDSFTGLERLAYALSLARGIATYVRQSSPRGPALRVVARGLRHGLGREPND
jgi:rhamnopyranosyl-N-acetylglucosaminyl-diphospho-decaprenol beta-1,3/1,4-galactofuranosyltransferase